MTSGENKDSPRLICIITRMFNVAAYVQECLDSIATQDFREIFEVIVIGDCSTDSRVGAYLERRGYWNGMLRTVT